MGTEETPPQGTPIFNGTAPYADTQSNDALTDQDIRRQQQTQQDQQAKGYGFFDAISASAQSDWVSAWAVRDLGGRAVDPDFNMSLDRFKQIAKDIPEPYQEYIAAAHSEEDLQARVQSSKQDADREANLAAMGWSGTGIRLATSLFDPTVVAAMAATDGLAAPVLAAAKVGRAGRVLLEGLAAGTSNAALTAASTVVDPKITSQDILASFGVGMFLGGTVGALRHNPATQSEADDLARIGKGIQQNSSAGAAQTPGSHIVQQQLDLLDGKRPDITDAPMAAYHKARVDIGGQLGSSESKLVRTLAPHMGEEAVGTTDHSVVPDAATTIQKLTHALAMRNWNTIVYPAFKEWATEQGRYGIFQRGKAWDEFQKHIANYVEERTPDEAVSKHVKAAVQGFRNVTADYAEQMQNPLRNKGGIARPLSEVGPDRFYLPKYADHESINTLVEKHGQAFLEEFAARAVKSIRPDIDSALADRIGKGWFRKIVGAGYGMEDKASLAMASADRDMLKSAFEDTGLTNEELDKVFNQIDSLKKPETDGAGFSRTKRRTLLDYTYAEQHNGETVSMKDFFSNDADFVLNRYSRQTSGRLALAQMRVKDTEGNVILDGIHGPADFEKLLGWVKDEWASLRVDRNGKALSHEAKRAGLDRDVENLKFLWDHVTGTPHFNPRNSTFQWMRRMRDYNFIRVMNRLGIGNQVQEFARVIGTLGVKAAFQQMPAFGRMLDEAGRSVPKGRLLQELELFSGRTSAMDFARHRYRYEDDLIGTRNFGRIGRSVDRLTAAGKAVTADISLMTHIYGWQQRLTIGAVSQRLYDMAKKTLVKGFPTPPKWNASTS
jgi:hypothetical protein